MGLSTSRSPLNARLGAFVSSQLQYLLPALVVRAAKEAKPGLLQDLAGCLGYRLRDILIDHFQVIHVTWGLFLVFSSSSFLLISYYRFSLFRVINTCILPWSPHFSHYFIASHLFPLNTFTLSYFSFLFEPLVYSFPKTVSHLVFQWLYKLQ